MNVKEILLSDLVQRDRLYFVKFSNEPFSGVITIGKETGVIKSGLKVGSWLEKDAQGNLVKEEYWHFGEKVFEGHYKMGNKHGKWVYFYQDEEESPKLPLLEKGRYRNGERTGHLHRID